MSTDLPQNVKKYIDKFSLNGWTNYNKLNKKYNTIIVVPAIAEYNNIKNLLKSLSENDSKYLDTTLVLFVINNLKTTSDEIKKDNSETINYLKDLIDNSSKSQCKLNLDFVDASTTGFELDEKDGGVGLARKIGMDLSLTLFDYQSEQKNILVCLDGDCRVENNYITTINDYFNKNEVSAGYVNFRHYDSENIENEKAIINYEIFLRYYVLGLSYANSPYAYHSIGSTMICDVESYIKVQGMNKRKAAEDFYFMEKLSKITPIKKINGTAVLPSSRGSWRVPFGTGQRVNRFMDKSQDEYKLYSPDSFMILKQWISLFFSNELLTAQIYLEKANLINKSLFNFLVKNNFENSWQKIVNNSSSNIQIQKQKHLWFDGFKTLKLIHFLRDIEHPTINMFDALDILLKKMKIDFGHKNIRDQIPSIEVQKDYLEILREIA